MIKEKHLMVTRIVPRAAAGRRLQHICWLDSSATGDWSRSDTFAPLR